MHPRLACNVGFCRRTSDGNSPGGAWTPGDYARHLCAKQHGRRIAKNRRGALPGCKAGVCKTQGERVHSFGLMQPVLDADFIIDIPKVKAHVMVGMTCAVKNLFGTVPGLSRLNSTCAFRPGRFRRHAGEPLWACGPDMVVADGIVAMEGDGPASGTPYALGLILGGQSAYDVDLAVCRLMGLPPQRVPYLALPCGAGCALHRWRRACCAATCRPPRRARGFACPPA